MHSHMDSDKGLIMYENHCFAVFGHIQCSVQKLLQECHEGCLYCCGDGAGVNNSHQPGERVSCSTRTSAVFKCDDVIIILHESLLLQWKCVANVVPLVSLPSLSLCTTLFCITLLYYLDLLLLYGICYIVWMVMSHAIS